jgi:phosphoglycerate dehydrogenase-like enzyme
MTGHRTLFLTERGLRHQRSALRAAPPELDVTMLRQLTPARSLGCSEEELRPYLRDAEFLISERTGVIDAETIAAAPQLKLILRLGTLAHDIDLEAARRAGVAVCIRPQPGAIMVAEHLVMQMLALVKRLREVEAVVILAAQNQTLSRRTDEDTFAYNWSGRQDIGALWGKTVGILGFGEIGTELARRLRGWNCRVFYHRRRRLPPTVERELAVSYRELDDLLPVTDVLVNLLPYAPETDRSLSAPAFAKLKRGAYLVSCGSGSVIVEADLAAALRAGHLAGAALDTFEWEPLPADNPLRVLALENRSANLLLTPHTAAGAAAAGVVPSRADDYVPIMQFLRGEPPDHRLV